MARPRVLTMIMAGGAGGRLELLTKGRAKPAVPYGGVYRLIDFPLSNCLHSGLEDVWVVEQVNPVSLVDHLANGRPWDLDRNRGGLLVLHPRLGQGAQGWHRGTADAVWRNAPLIREFAPDALVVLSADAVYRLDYRTVAEEHLASGADCTMVTTRVATDDAGRYGVVQAGPDGAVVDYAYKPDSPKGDLVSTEVLVLAPGPALAILDELGRDADEEEGLGDFGDALLPRLVEGGGAREHRLTDYWRDVGTVASYWEGHMDLLDPDPRIDLDDLAWPILTHGAPRPPARVDGASIAAALVAPGAVVRGRVERSVLSSGAIVERGATVRHSVLLPGAVVRAGAVVDHAVLDDGVEVGEGAHVGGDGGDGDEPAIVLVGRYARVPGGGTVEAGGRVPAELEP